MEILNQPLLDRFVRKHRDAAPWIERWINTVQEADWGLIDDVREVYPSADGVRVKKSASVIVVVTVFNVKGNTYRLLTLINYELGLVRVVDCLTHPEYDRDTWKDRL